MNTLVMRGNWNVVRGKLKQKWSKLTNDDLKYREGQEDELVGRIQKRVGKTRAAVERALKKRVLLAVGADREETKPC